MNFLPFRYLYLCVLKAKYKLKQIRNEIHKSTGRVYWIIEDDKITINKPKTNESDRYFNERSK